MIHRITLPCIFVVCAVCAPASAEESAPAPASSGNLEYRFDDDPLDGVGLDQRGERIRVRPGRGRVTLIRPRTHFIPELTRAVENL